ncbi:UDP-N-acetylglucosamine pyrophosphorylase [Ceratobasidium sp. 392]|nr:UDP-N-acetylglucosamine pyrophosphorylase [Ceratobasidium sp. 392]
MASLSTYAVLKEKYEKAGQSQVLNFWPQLSEAEQVSLSNQLAALDIERVNRVFAKAIQSEKDAKNSTQDEITPPPSDSFDSILGDEAKEAEFRKIGLQAIADGKVGVLLMAGGQGTRLGSSDPKGCYDIGLPSHKSLFQYQAERIARLQVLASGGTSPTVKIPWYVMTSGPTRKATETFFTQNEFFGLDASQVVFFEQGTLPCLDNDGKVLLDSPSSVAVAPDGNGGLYAALRSPISPGSSTTVLSDLADRKIDYIHAYCVDNCLVRQRRWLEKAGATVAEGVEIEISPKVSYAGEGLEEVKGKTFTRSGLVENVHELDSLV